MISPKTPKILSQAVISVNNTAASEILILSIKVFYNMARIPLPNSTAKLPSQKVSPGEMHPASK